ncbi:hypothetical protein GCM10010429_48300 [Micromonospora olivasterospora]
MVVSGDGRGVVGHAGTRLLADMADVSGLTSGFSDALALLRQRRAGELVQYHLYQDSIVQCMKGKDFLYTPPPFVDIYAGLTDLQGLSGTWFAETTETGLGVADSAVRLAPLDVETSNPGFQRLDPKGQRLYDDALTECTPTSTPDVYIPANSSKQNDKLLDLFAKMEKSRR